MNLKVLLTSAPILVHPAAGEALLIYVAATTQVVSAAIMVERREEGHALLVQRPVYFISEVLSETKIRYPQNSEAAVRGDPDTAEVATLLRVSSGNCGVILPLGRSSSAERPRVESQSERWKSWAKQDRKSTRLNSSHITRSRMPSSA